MSFVDNLTAQLPFGKRSENTEYFFALNIGLSEVTAAVWGVTNHKIDIIGKSSLFYEDTEDLLDKAHQVLDKALGVFEVEPQKILFGVPDSWTLEDNLKDPYLKLLRTMIKEYDLQPLAYVTTTHAISHLLQKLEGIPPTAVLLGVGEFVEVTLFRAGKILETRSTKRSEHLFGDIEKILSQFTEVEVVPSKILLYATNPRENIIQLRDDLITYPWMQNLSFLHFPKIENLEDDICILAIVAAGVAEVDPDADIKHTLVMAKPKLSEKPVLTRTRVLAEDHLGFVRGDIKEYPQKEEEDTSSEEISEEMERSLLPSDEFDIEKENFIPAGKKEIQTRIALMALPFKFFSKFGKAGGIFRGPAILIVGILMVLAVAYIFLVKATVTIFIEPKILEKTATVVADPGVSSVDEEKNIIPGKVVETAVTGSGRASATGKKLIGDQAKGTVIVYNATKSQIKLSQGAVLVSDSGLKFTLDNPVQVASKSASAAAPPSASSAVGITAVVIGPDSNIPGGTELKVSDFGKADAVAKIDQALSGGTSKEVTVVTSEDQKKLQEKVTDELRQKAIEELKGKTDPDKKVIAESLIVVSGKYDFSKRVNDQASEFNLSANVRFKGTSYADPDLRTLVAKLISTNVPDGFELNLSDTETRADISKVEKDGKLVFDAKFRAKLSPKLDSDQIKKKIKGKSVGEVFDILRGLENVIGSEIKLSPNLPTKFARMPLLDKNISIVVTPR